MSSAAASAIVVPRMSIPESATAGVQPHHILTAASTAVVGSKRPRSDDTDVGAADGGIACPTLAHAGTPPGAAVADDANTATVDSTTATTAIGAVKNPPAAVPSAAIAAPPARNISIKSRQQPPTTAGRHHSAFPSAPSAAAITPPHSGGTSRSTAASAFQLKIHNTAPAAANASSSSNANVNAHSAASYLGGHPRGAATTPPSIGGGVGGASAPATPHARYTALFEAAITSIVDLFRSGGGLGLGVASPTAPPASPLFASPRSIATADFVEPREVAKAIATALLAATNNSSNNGGGGSGGTVDSNVAERVKTLLFHLRDVNNVDLRFRLATGELSGADFVHLNTYTQLFNKKKRVEAAKAVRAAEDTADGSALAAVVASSLYECPSCKARRHTLVQIQTRSADEPMTEICQCLGCSHTWRPNE